MLKRWTAHHTHLRERERRDGHERNLQTQQNRRRIQKSWRQRIQRRTSEERLFGGLFDHNPWVCLGLVTEGLVAPCSFGALIFEEASLSVFRHKAILITAVPQKDRFWDFSVKSYFRRAFELSKSLFSTIKYIWRSSMDVKGSSCNHQCQ